MKITYSQECRALLARLELLPTYIDQTCQAPAQMMLTQSKPPQYYAARWFGNGKVVFVHGIFNKKSEDPAGQEIEVHSALELKESLPVGRITPEMPMRQIFLVVVNSFGIPVSCHPDRPPARLYAGSWDGKMVHCNLQRDEYYQVSGDFNLREGYAQDVWVFSYKLYREWFING